MIIRKYIHYEDNLDCTVLAHDSKFEVSLILRTSVWNSYN